MKGQGAPVLGMPRTSVLSWEQAGCASPGFSINEAPLPSLLREAWKLVIIHRQIKSTLCQAPGAASENRTTVSKPARRRLLSQCSRSFSERDS